MTAWRLVAVAAWFASAAACFRPGEERAELDEKVGFASAGGVSFHVSDGLAAVREAEPGALRLWSQSPVLTLEVSSSAAATTGWSLTVANCMPGSTVLSSAGTITWQPVASDGVTTCAFQVMIPQGAVGELRIGPSDADERAAFSFAVLSDIQDALPDIGDIWALMNRDAGLRFVASMGDLTENGGAEQMDRFQRSLAGLSIPYYSTLGNHDIGGDVRDWHARFGRFSFHWQMHGVHLSFVDSASAGLDPKVYEWLQGWLDQGKAAQHVVLTHFPPFDPVGARGGAFRSTAEASKFAGMLASGAVDTAFFGHLHSFYALSVGGVPAYISGGGGAIAETMDGIGRHYLRVTMNPVAGTSEVNIVRVD